MSAELDDAYLFEFSLNQQLRAAAREDRCEHCRPYCARQRRWHGTHCRCGCPSSLEEFRTA